MGFDINFDFVFFLLSPLQILCNKWPFMKRLLLSKLLLFASNTLSFGVDNQNLGMKKYFKVK
jgi:hypothetical protein